MTQPKERVFEEFKEFLTTQNAQLKKPENADKVYKDECVYCFDTPFMPGFFVLHFHDSIKKPTLRWPVHIVDRFCWRLLQTHREIRAKDFCQDFPESQKIQVETR